MALEQVFKCSGTLNNLRSGPLGDLMDGFCTRLLEDGFAPGTIRKHLSNVHHLNVYLDTRNHVDGQVLSAAAVRGFFTHYPAWARHRGPLDRHIAAVKASVNRLVNYLRFLGRFEASTEVLIYQPLLEAYLKWLQERQHAAPGTIRLRAHSVGQFLCWLGSQATPQGCSELTPKSVEHFLFNLCQLQGACSTALDAGGFTHFLPFLFTAGIHSTSIGSGSTDIALLQAFNSGARSE